MLSVKTIVERTYERWGEAVKDLVTDYSMENSTTVSDLPYASMYFMGLPTKGFDLEGGESGVTPSLQIDIYAKGQKAMDTLYSIDEASHEALNEMGYRRTYGPELAQNIDPSIRRLVSRYQRVIGYGEDL